MLLRNPTKALVPRC